MRKEWYKFEGLTEEELNIFTGGWRIYDTEINEYGFPVKYFDENGVIIGFALLLSHLEFDELFSDLLNEPEFKDRVRITKVKTE